MITKCKVHSLNLSEFDWNADTGLLTAEVSKLGVFRIERLFDDAADMGIAIRSHHTGKVQLFVLVKTDVAAGYYVGGEEQVEVAGWHFKPVVPGGNVKEVLVIND